ncbi:MAG: hypothetical protein AB1796_09445 [Bacillota bacterium]
MRRQRMSFFQKSGGVIIAVAGLILIVKTLPLYLWPLLLGLLLIWLGWRLYAVNY